MAASKSFAFEEREFTEASNAQLAPGSVPDFEAFGAIDLGAVSPRSEWCKARPSISR